jgi:hypothetical protein
LIILNKLQQLNLVHLYNKILSIDKLVQKL